MFRKWKWILRIGVVVTTLAILNAPIRAAYFYAIVGEEMTQTKVIERLGEPTIRDMSFCCIGQPTHYWRLPGGFGVTMEFRHDGKVHFVWPLWRFYSLEHRTFGRDVRKFEQG